MNVFTAIKSKLTDLFYCGKGTWSLNEPQLLNSLDEAEIDDLLTRLNTFNDVTLVKLVELTDDEIELIKLIRTVGTINTNELFNQAELCRVKFVRSARDQK